jgi:hypothetical protein
MDLLSAIGLVVVLSLLIIGAAWGWSRWTARAAPPQRADYERQVLSSLRRIEVLLAILAASLLVRLILW